MASPPQMCCAQFGQVSYVSDVFIFLYMLIINSVILQFGEYFYIIYMKKKPTKYLLKRSGHSTIKPTVFSSRFTI